MLPASIFLFVVVEAPAGRCLVTEKMYKFSIGLPVHSNYHEKEKSVISVSLFGQLVVCDRRLFNVSDNSTTAICLVIGAQQVTVSDT
jgi:hypothetical protein